MKRTLDLGPPSRGVASKSIPSARVKSALSSAMNRTLVPSGASWVFHALQHRLKNCSGETRRDPLEHKGIVDGNDVHVVDPLFFELLVGGYVARNVPVASSGERARYANLQGVSPVLLPHNPIMPYNDVFAREFGNMECLLRVIFFDCCAGGELAARLYLSVGHCYNVMRN